MKLNKDDKKLVERAKSLVSNKKVSGGVVGEVGSALKTKKGKIFTGVSLDLCCGIGFCGEHSAIANMISHSNETEIETIVAFGDKIMYPCGRCREMMRLINNKNWQDTLVIINDKNKVKLKELLPGNWM